MDLPVIIEVSARHIHLTQDDAQKLFGVDHQFGWLKDISQPGQYADKETVEIESKAGRKIAEVRVMGPWRDKTYAELSLTDLFYLKLTAPTMIEAKPEMAEEPVVIRGPKGEIVKKAVIVKMRHIHCDVMTAEKYGLKDDDEVSVAVPGVRALVFHQVKIRVHKDFVLRFHVDTDEANAAGVKVGAVGKIILGRDE